MVLSHIPPTCTSSSPHPCHAQLLVVCFISSKQLPITSCLPHCISTIHKHKLSDSPPFQLLPFTSCLPHCISTIHKHKLSDSPLPNYSQSLVVCHTASLQFTKHKLSDSPLPNCPQSLVVCSTSSLQFSLTIVVCYIPLAVSLKVILI
jgi:hypothetical protein